MSPGLMPLLGLLLFFAAVSGADKFRVLHITDLHGWVRGHRHVSGGADYGDFVSLAERLRNKTLAEGTDFFLFDSGDLVDGSGISDSTAVKGEDIFPLVEQVDFDALTIGNHDLGHANTTALMMQSGGFISHWGGRYLSANAIWKSNNTVMGSQYRVWDTAMGHRALAMGFIFDFTAEANNTAVTPVAKSVQEPWFAEAISQVCNSKDDAAARTVDVLFVTCHVDPQASNSEMPTIYSAIRGAVKKQCGSAAVFNNLPLVVLSGHRHRLFFSHLPVNSTEQDQDPNAFTLESGKYLENVGLIDFNVDVGGASGGGLSQLNTTWINSTLDKWAAVAGTTPAALPTKTGSAVQAQMAAEAHTLGLDKVVGCSPSFYSPFIYDISDPGSFYGLLINQIAPNFVVNKSREAALGVLPFFATNAASLRYCLYAGNVTVDDIYNVSPFTDPYVGIAGLTGAQLKKLVAWMQTTPWDATRHGFGARSDPRSEEFGTASNPRYMTQPVDDIEDGKTYEIIAPHYDAILSQFSISYGISHLFGAEVAASLDVMNPYLGPSSDETTSLVNYLSASSGEGCVAAPSAQGAMCGAG